MNRRLTMDGHWTSRPKKNVRWRTRAYFYPSFSDRHSAAHAFSPSLPNTRRRSRLFFFIFRPPFFFIFRSGRNITRLLRKILRKTRPPSPCLRPKRAYYIRDPGYCALEDFTTLPRVPSKSTYVHARRASCVFVRPLNPGIWCLAGTYIYI